MNAESKEFQRPDLIMVPSTKSTTGWKYVEKSHLDAIREKRTMKLPGLKGVIKAAKANSSDRSSDPNSMFPDTSNEMLMTNGPLKDRATGLQTNFKLT